MPPRPGDEAAVRDPGAPTPEEYAPFYAGYVGHVPPGEALRSLRRTPPPLVAALAGVSDREAGTGYAPGKWSLKQLVGHVADAERVFAYRALRIARGDATPLPGFEQNAYVAAARAGDRGLADVLEEFRTVRLATLALVQTFGAAEYAKRGSASGSTVSVRALLYIIAGHELHHADVVRTRYLRDGANRS